MEEERWTTLNKSGGQKLMRAVIPPLNEAIVIHLLALGLYEKDNR